MADHGHNGANNSWLEEHDRKLAQLHRKGFSASEIARAMNQEFTRQFTRNAIIGRVHRLKLSRSVVVPPGPRPAIAEPKPVSLPPRRALAWTPERDDFVREKRAEEWPDHRIAEHLTDMGFPISRSGVRDRAKKLGIAGPGKKGRPAQSKANAQKPSLSPVPLPPYVSKEEAWLPLPESRRVQIVEIREGLCKWPLWDGPAIGEFCGADSGDHRYCPGHRRLGMSQQVLKPIHVPRETKRAVREKVEDLMRVMA